MGLQAAFCHSTNRPTKTRALGSSLTVRGENDNRFDIDKASYTHTPYIQYIHTSYHTHQVTQLRKPAQVNTCSSGAEHCLNTYSTVSSINKLCY